jgi:hypothetical protein
LVRFGLLRFVELLLMPGLPLGFAFSLIVPGTVSGTNAVGVGSDEGEAVQGAVAIVGHLPAGSYEGHSIAIVIIPEAGGRRKGILRPDMAV